MAVEYPIYHLKMPEPGLRLSSRPSQVSKKTLTKRERHTCTTKLSMACRDVQVPFKPFNCIISSYTIFVGMLATRKAGFYRNFEMINATNKNSSCLIHTKRFNFKSTSKPYCFIKTILKVGYFEWNIFKTHQRTIHARLLCQKLQPPPLCPLSQEVLKMIFEMHIAFAH